MSIDDLLFEPLVKPISSPQSLIVNHQIRRYQGAIFADISAKVPKSIYTDLATEIIDFAVKDLPGLSDVRTQGVSKPRGALDLTTIVSRFHDGATEIWISCPYQMDPEPFEFYGRFGYVRACKMPNHKNRLITITWYSIDTDKGQLPAIDLGLLLYNPRDRWYRVFTNKVDANDYFTS